MRRRAAAGARVGSFMGQSSPVTIRPRSLNDPRSRLPRPWSSGRKEPRSVVGPLQFGGWRADGPVRACRLARPVARARFAVWRETVLGRNEVDEGSRGPDAELEASR